MARHVYRIHTGTRYVETTNVEAAQAAADAGCTVTARTEGRR